MAGPVEFQSRTYQSDAVNSVLNRYHQNRRQLLLRLPTGAGKTVIAALIIEQMLSLIGQRRVLFLAHRREILDQSAEKISRRIGIEKVTIEQAERYADAHARVVVASIQTLAGRLESYDPQSFGLVIVDECHHAFAKTWLDTIGHFAKNPDTLLIGLTATPKRSDGRCISQLFNETAFEISLGELQDRGFLVPMNYFTIEASLGLGDVQLDQKGDFQTTLLGKIMNSPEMRALTLRACLEKALGKKTLAFCASVSHAQDLASDFNEAGMSAACITGQSHDRDANIQAFREGRIQVLTNFGVLTEGFDDPSIECVLLARPTTSPLVYSQCLGRGLRIHPAKTSCVVIDIVDRQRHQLQYNAFEAAGLQRSWRGSGKDPLREAEAIARIRVTDPQAFLKLKKALSLAETHKILMNLDPATVLAGIDGMPLLRYRAIAEEYNVSPEAKLSRAEGILRVAGWIPSALKISGDVLEALFIDAREKGPSPYLAWHLEQATGFMLKYGIEAPPPIRTDAALPEIAMACLSLTQKPSPPRTAPGRPAPAPTAANALARGEAAVAPAKTAEKRLNLISRLDALKGESQRKAAAQETLQSGLERPQTVKVDAPKINSIQDKLRALKEGLVP